VRQPQQVLKRISQRPLPTFSVAAWRPNVLDGVVHEPSIRHDGNLALVWWPPSAIRPSRRQVEELYKLIKSR
jgi:hypothetical protein